MKYILSCFVALFACGMLCGQNITAGEYFFDTDPGVGNATAMPGFTAADTVNVNMTINTASLSSGFHKVYTRFRDNNGKWGLYQGAQFYVLPSVSSSSAANIVAGEYFFDTDPGLGNGTALPAFAAGDTVNNTLNISTAGLSSGFHRIYIRYRDASGKWGLYQGAQFYVLPTVTLPQAANLVSAEYFFDTDPGIGNGTALPAFSPADTVNQTLSLSTASLSAGTHRIYIRYRDASGKWGLYQGDEFNIINCQLANADFSAANVCVGDSVQLIDNSTNVASSATYAWDINNDGSTEYTTAGNVSHYFASPGQYNVLLSIDDQGCTDTVLRQVNVLAPVNGTDVQAACGSYTWIDGNTYTSNNNTATFTISNGAANGCDSVVTLNLTINSGTTGTDVQTACNSYTWIDGNTYTSNNNTATFNIAGGAANGCDSLVTLNLTISNVATGTDVQSACNSYTWIDGNTYTSNNNTATFNIAGGAANGCDSLVTLNLTISNIATGTDVQSACNSYTWIDGNTYTSNNSTATYTISGGSAAGCDSVVTLNLTITGTASGTDTQVACGSYTWIDGNTYTSNNNTATYTITGGSVYGCDSIVTLDLTISSVVNGTDVQSACGSFVWIDGQTYTASNNTATYTLTGGSVNGCDSIVTLDLTINTPASGTDIQTACGTYTWIDGQTYTASNNSATFTVSGGAANGCDSVVTLDLTILTAATSTDVQTACGTYTWIDGQTYTASNNSATFTVSGGAANGCDSVITLNLTINTVSDITVSQNGATLTANNGNATYQWIDCDNGNAAIGGATAQVYTATANGNYAVVLTENGCSDTSACVNVVISGIELTSLKDMIKVYPNPTSSIVYVKFSTVAQEIFLNVYDAQGKVYQQLVLTNSNLVPIELPDVSGLYLLDIRTEKGRASFNVIKE